ncbi:hypothetical protein SAMN05661086_02911 [Anaeromicropila populeti]|uniref:Flavoprotein, HI0933 family n=2 Tax=Anaeromicropila populeti TaxID=37658 RepID=A0A1I6KYM3_9FIRM|nr:hypothetical protein SAMN05661086_02911 [Anaeromicropila populeti]
MDAEIIIIGGGASGLMAAIAAGRKGKKVILIEQKDRIGKKILATGNGKCNFSNTYQDSRCYRSDNSSFPIKVLERFGVDETVSWFENLGILVKERNGYLYPNSLQASSILDVLRLETARLGIKVYCEERVTKIKEYNQGFRVFLRRREITGKKIILAAGGKASPQHGSDGSGYLLAESLGHHIIPTVPALTGLKVKEGFCGKMAGVRTEAAVSLFIEDKLVSKDIGELQLTGYGISGIPVFQVSRYAGKGLLEKKKVTAQIDFFPDRKEEDIWRKLQQNIKAHPDDFAEDMLTGIMNKKIYLVLMKEAGIKANAVVKSVPTDKWRKLSAYMKGLSLHIIDSNGFETAQVTAGGVDTREINERTMESKLKKNLYMIGELLDVDGICGGYNLQWAWSTGFIAGNHAGTD